MHESFNETKMRIYAAEQRNKRMATSILCVALAGFLGWCYETAFDAVRVGSFVMREAFLLPWCPIYSIGMILILIVNYAAFEKHGRRCPTISAFPMSMAVAVISELVGSYAIEFSTGGHIPWDYSDYFLNFQGRIALAPAVVFGLGGAFVLLFAKPRIERAADEHYDGTMMIAYLVAILFATDIVLNSIGAYSGIRSEIERSGLAKLQEHT